MLNAGTQEIESAWSGGGGSGTGKDADRCARLHRTLRRIVKARGALDAAEAAALREAHKILEQECGERLDVDAVISAMARRVIDGDTDVSAKPRGRSPYQIAITVCRECKRGWQDGGGLTVEMSPAGCCSPLRLSRAWW
jgi:hypothetical protein